MFYILLSCSIRYSKTSWYTEKGNNNNVNNNNNLQTNTITIIIKKMSDCKIERKF